VHKSIEVKQCRVKAKRPPECVSIHTRAAARPFFALTLAFTRYCHYQYCRVFIAIKGSGKTIYCVLVWAMKVGWGEGGGGQRGCLQIIWCIRAQKPQRISCKGQPSWPPRSSCPLCKIFVLLWVWAFCARSNHPFIATPSCRAYPIATLMHDHCAIYAPPHRVPLLMPYPIQYWWWKYRVKATPFAPSRSPRSSCPLQNIHLLWVWAFCARSNPPFLPPACIAHTNAILLHDYCTIYDPLPPRTPLCIPYTIPYR